MYVAAPAVVATTVAASAITSAKKDLRPVIVILQSPIVISPSFARTAALVEVLVEPVIRIRCDNAFKRRVGFTFRRSLYIPAGSGVMHSRQARFLQRNNVTASYGASLAHRASPLP